MLRRSCHVAVLALVVSLAAAAPTLAQESSGKIVTAEELGVTMPVTTTLTPMSQSFTALSSACSSGRACVWPGTQYSGSGSFAGCGSASLYPIGYFAYSAKNRCGERRIHLLRYLGGGAFREEACIRPGYEQPFIPASDYLQVGGGNCG